MAGDSDPEKGEAANKMTAVNEKHPATVDPNLVRTISSL
jgi:hypothetical protein